MPEDTAEQFPERGVWSNISVGAGTRRATPLLVMDSKKILWIMFGDTSGPSDFMTVWNYDPKTDLYRWVAGPGNTSTARDPGELRVPAATNAPGKVYYTISTIDRNDNIWFLTTQYCCELWMFNTTSLMFTRMQGQAGVTTAPSYGTPGQPGEDVYPAGALQTACFVPDALNNLWLLSGNSDNQATNRVWHFNTTSLLWTFISGNSTLVSTTWGEPPFYGGRQAPACDIDENDRVWLFGGLATTYFSDMWSFDTRTTQWQLERGSAASVNNGPNVASDEFHPDNVPRSREVASLVDRKDGTLLMACGYSTQALSNDVWLFNKTSKYWKMIYGESTGVVAGNLTNYRAPGSVMPGRFYHGKANGLNINGDAFMYGGRSVASETKDIWVIPQDQCAHPTMYECGTNAHCVEEIIGYSCACDEGFTGDGETCTADQIPQAPVSVTPTSQPAVNAPKSISVVSSGVRIVGSSLVLSLVLVVLAL